MNGNSLLLLTVYNLVPVRCGADLTAQDNAGNTALHSVALQATLRPDLVSSFINVSIVVLLRLS